ncbi:MAG: hypothetical protein ACKVS7_10525, partial [Gemmatimonadaceae bacterium]
STLSAGVVRVCLGAIAGVFGSMALATSEPSISSLPPLVIPFVLGYGLEILFSFLDRVVGMFSQGDASVGQPGARTG